MRPRRRSLLAAACLAVALTACSSPTHHTAPAPSVATSPHVTPTHPSTRAASTPTPSPHRETTKSSPHRATTTAPPPVTSTAAPQSATLPLDEPTGDATQVITVVGASHQSTTATLQAWTGRGGRWTRFGGPVTAWVGSDGLSEHASESSSATPIGSFTLTRAFGSQPDPGTGLPYLRTTPADWWISQAGPLYNTEQRCSGTCGFTQGDPNEHLYYTQPFYRLAVVIDYNTANAPGGVRAGAGSAFFLHVTVGAPTAGCVAIPEAALTALMRWLTPSAHPRILIGTA